jgi:alpha-amylase
MTTPIYLSLVFHNHQPVGQFDDVSEHSTQVSYLPLINLLERHPTVHVGMHFTGPLLEWLIAHHQYLIDRLKTLVTRGQVEILTGGYYEPVLVALPDEDKIGQIRKLSDMIKSTFGTTATGVWLAERVWEPHLAKPIAEAGGRYVIVDDTHFEGVGFDKDKDLFGYYMTEEQGQVLAVFPTLTYLRYAIPWSPVEKVIQWLRLEADKPLLSGMPKIAFVSDDGEKFGTWPGTYEHCWGSGKYMEALFTAIEKNSEWIKTTAPTDFMRQAPALGRVYLPAASYMEMGEWSLPVAASRQLKTLKQQFENEKRTDVLRFVRSGIWRNFMVKYDEINHMHKRALMVSRKVHAMRHGRKREQALDLLWAAQSNDPYWHGVFGGIYLFNIRVANYANLIAAEALAEGDTPSLLLDTYDFDGDGQPELLMSGDIYNAIWAPGVGGALIELDHRAGRYNLLNLMNRHEEAYHSDLIEAVRDNRLITPETPTTPEIDNPSVKVVRAKETGLEKQLIYDWHRHASFVDHFLGPKTTLDEFYRAHYAEQGDFVNQPYRAETTATDEEIIVHLVRDGHIWIADKHVPIRVTKIFTYRRRNDVFKVQYTVSNRTSQPVEMRFAIETAVGFDGGQDIRYSSLRLNDNPARLRLYDIDSSEQISRYQTDSNIRSLTLTTELSQSATLWRFPLETITLSEAGFERGYQGTIFVQSWPLQLAAEAAWSVTITQRVTQESSK